MHGLSSEFSWNAITIPYLKQRWDDGASASVIANELGNGCTRNSVIGKASRLGLAARKESPRASDGPLTQRRRMSAARKVAFEREVEPVQAELPSEATPVADLKALFDLTEDTCRWPIGDPGFAGFGFCGNMPAAGRTYCGGHCRIAYVPARRN